MRFWKLLEILISVGVLSLFYKFGHNKFLFMLLLFHTQGPNSRARDKAKIIFSETRKQSNAVLGIENPGSLNISNSYTPLV